MIIHSFYLKHTYRIANNIARTEAAFDENPRRNAVAICNGGKSKHSRESTQTKFLAENKQTIKRKVQPAEMKSKIMTCT